MARLLDLAVDCGFDRCTAAACLTRLVEFYGEDGQHWITVENCGDDFITSLADAMQATEDWDDLKVIESEASGNLNGMVINSSIDDKGGVAAASSPLFRKAAPSTSKEVKADPSASKKRKANSSREGPRDNSTADGSDLGTWDEMDNYVANSFSVKRKIQSGSSELQIKSSANSEDAKHTVA